MTMTVDPAAALAAAARKFLARVNGIALEIGKDITRALISIAREEVANVIGSSQVRVLVCFCKFDIL